MDSSVNLYLTPITPIQPLFNPYSTPIQPLFNHHPQLDLVDSNVADVKKDKSLLSPHPKGLAKEKLNKKVVSC